MPLQRNFHIVQCYQEVVFSLDIEHSQVEEHFQFWNISVNPPWSHESVSHCLRSAKLEDWQISKLIIPIDSPFNQFLWKHLVPIVNRSQVTRVQIVRKPGGNVAKLFLNQTSFYLSTGVTGIIFFSFNESNKPYVIISDSISLKL